MKNHDKALLLFVMALIFLAGCSASFEEEQAKASGAVEEAFKGAANKRNHENKEIEYNLPFGFEVKEETANNIILKNGAKTYILFYNLQEDASSVVVLNATLQQKEFDLDERFTEEGKLGYLLVKRLSEKENEVTVGIGGVKITSEVKTKNLAAEAEAMMHIVNSVHFKS
ncbi:hypothetical protein PZE06_10830 [Robertmurraya sp. DFI.2.37]|uniref:hypothetical protein n=1 Tax=Robertmurraya sp. DFI.2.37 TaxID=3031819 RepID=UPI0012485991|nr:hypothetical protein [Robertmurraya sp. DFI.2.37]MDF1508685.1 hypothetical protein [Robertmurraya sp. DFI.2.37]